MNKLDEVVLEARWKMSIKKDDYPITFIFRKDPYADLEELNGQQKITGKLDEIEDESVPEIRIVFKDEIEYELLIPSDEPLDDKFFNKLKNLSKEVHRLYLLFWFSEKRNRFERQFKPLWQISSGATVGIVGKFFEP
jgi:hypothetical protein